MGDFTKLPLDDAQQILGEYGLGSISQFHAQSLGISNSNYKIELGDQPAILLKVSNDKNIEELKKELTILEFLNRQNFPYALMPLKNLAHHYYYQYQQYVGVLYPFIDGVVLKPTADSVHQIGHALASLHKTTANCDLTTIRSVYEVTYGPRDIQRFTNTVLCPADYKEYFEKLGGLQLIEEFKQAPTRTCLVHGDLYFDNCLFKNKKLITMLDFEQSGQGEMLLDLGISISGSCLDSEGLIDKDLINHYLAGYLEINPLSSSEMHLIDSAILIGLLSISLWRIYRFTLGSLDQTRKESYLELLSRAWHYRKSII